MYNINRSRKLLSVFVIFLLTGLKTHAQGYWENDSINFYRITIALGAGKGYPQQKTAAGMAVAMEFAYQRKNQLFSIGMHGLSDGKSSDDKSDVSNSVTAAYLVYGRAFTKRRFFASLQTGVGYVYTEEKGKMICQCGTTYEKIKGSAIGLDVSLKILRVNTYAGKGLELFVNMNTRASFGGVNFCFQFGKLKRDDWKTAEHVVYKNIETQVFFASFIDLCQELLPHEF